MLFGCLFVYISVANGVGWLLLPWFVFCLFLASCWVFVCLFLLAVWLFAVCWFLFTCASFVFVGYYFVCFICLLFVVWLVLFCFLMFCFGFCWFAALHFSLLVACFVCGWFCGFWFIVCDYTAGGELLLLVTYGFVLLFGGVLCFGFGVFSVWVIVLLFDFCIWLV